MAKRWQGVLSSLPMHAMIANWGWMDWVLASLVCAGFAHAVNEVHDTKLLVQKLEAELRELKFFTQDAVQELDGRRRP